MSDPPTASGEQDPAEHNESLEVEIRISQEVSSPLEVSQIVRCVRIAALHCGYTSGCVGVLVTDDATIHQINRDHLQHDYATDVISFGYSAEGNYLEGELVVSVDTARSMAAINGLTEQTELSLYLIHGTLHIAGMDDHRDQDRSAMRNAEREILLALQNHEVDRIGAEWTTDNPSNQDPD